LLKVESNAIEFWNISYTDCSGQTTSSSLYNFTDSNSISNLPINQCNSSASSSSTTTSYSYVPSTPLPTQVITSVNVMTNIPTAIIITNPKIDLTKITITANQNIFAASLIINKLSQLPTSNPQIGLPLGIPYQAFQINTTMITNLSIANATLEFKVNKSWAASQNVDPSTITLYRMKANDTIWNPLNTTFLGQDNNSYHFSAVTPGFSTFIIYSNQKCIANSKRCLNNQTQLCLNSTWMTTEQCPNGCNNEGCSNLLSNNPPIIYGVIILMILIVGAMLLNKKKKTRKYHIPHKHFRKRRS